MRHPYSRGVASRVGKERQLHKIGLCTLKYDNHSRLNRQHNWRGRGGDLLCNEHENLRFNNEKHIHMREVATASIWIC